jgi:hypothetical protein
MSRIATDDIDLVSRDRCWELIRANNDEPNEFYKYDNLSEDSEKKQIRLLEILPDDSGFCVVSCKIHFECLKTPTRYEALSYVWGESFQNRWIWVIQNGRGYRLNVTDNLYAALWRLRHHHGSRWMWVDAICINQSNTSERTAQVGMMRDIYAYSTRVVIWVGEKEGNSEQAISLVKHVNAVAKSDREHNVKRDLFTQPPGQPRLPEAWKLVWWDLFALLERPWFQRVWIVHELVVSPHPIIACGRDQLLWSQLWDAISYVTTIAATRLPAYAAAKPRVLLLNNLQQMRQRFQAGNSRPSVVEVLLYNRNAETTDARDHIFAFYGLLPPGSPASLIPDYGKKLSCDELYRKVAVDLMHHEGGLNLLSITSVMRPTTTPYLPTWAPDWSANGPAECFLTRYYITDFSPDLRPTYRASGNSVCEPTFDDEERRLLLKGYTVGTITRFSEVIIPAPVPGTSWITIKRFARGCLEFHRAFRSCEDVAGLYEHGKYFTGESRLKAYYQTLFGGAGDFDQVPVELVQMAFKKWYLFQVLPLRILQLLRLDFVWVFLTLALITTFLSSPIVLLFGWRCSAVPGLDFSFLANRAAHRRIVRTTIGHVGLAPASAKPGDSILLYEGGKLPAVLRRKGDEWEFIGHCYIHGLMDGLFWETTLEVEGWTRKKSLKKEEFWVA